MRAFTSSSSRAVAIAAAAAWLWGCADERDGTLTGPSTPASDHLDLDPSAAPVHDDFDDVIEIASLPFTHGVNTSEATTAVDDPDCVGQGPTVWYAFTPSEDGFIEANTFGSDYDTTLSAYIGSRGALTQIARNDDAEGVQSRIVIEVLAGEPVFFMVGAFASGPGGELASTWMSDRHRHRPWRWL